jgi:phospholipid/cholesterol/gamma-HCH transport system substrate-binding protein
MIWFAFWLAKYGLQKEFDYYKVQMSESVSGLSKDSTVKLHGVDVGSISEIRINPKDIEKVEIVLKINRGTPIKEDMVVFTEMYGVTGIAYIQIDGGTNEAKTLEPTEDYIPIIATAPSWFTKTTKGLGTLAERITLLVDKSQKLLSEKNIETLGKVFDNTERLTAKGLEVEEKAINSLDEVDITLREFRASMAKINDKLTRVTEDFTTMQKDFTDIKKVSMPTIDKLMETSNNFNRVTLKFEKSLDRGDYNAKKMLEPMLIDISILSQQMTDLAKEFEQSPNDIFFKSRKSRRGPGE